MKLLNIKYYIVAILIIFASCSKEENKLDVSVNGDDDFVNIGSLYTSSDNSYNTIITADTKVEYGSLNATSNKWALKWSSGDKVKITRHGKVAQSQDYIVTPTGDGKSASVQINGKEEDRLRWSTGASSDIFSIAYPSNAVVGRPSNFEVELQFDMKSSIEAVIDGESSVDMSKFRMINFQSVNRGDNSVNLTTVPATTTLDITIKGPSSGYLPITRIVIAINNSNKYISKEGKVKYKYNNGKLEYGTYSDAPEQVIFLVTLTNKGEYIDLYSGHSIRFKTFIPGIPYNSGDYKVSVNYGATGKEYSPTKTLSENVMHPLIINASSGDDTGWIEDLPDDMKVKDMSIPGSYLCLSYMYSLPASHPITQELDVSKQCEVGIRVFHQSCTYYQNQSDDLGKGKITGAARGYGVNAYIGENINKDILYKLIDYLKKHPKEFFIVINNYYEVTGSYNTFNSVYNAALKRVVTNANYSKYFYTGTFDGNTTIKNLRGKIVVVHQSSDASVGPVLSGWSSKDQAAAVNNYNIGNISASVCASDEWENFGTYDNLIAGIKANIQRAVDGSFAITELVQHHPDRTRDGYVNEFKFIMPSILWSLNYYNKTGILLMGYVGVRYPNALSSASGEYTYGDVLPQIVVNKNFK